MTVVINSTVLLAAVADPDLQIRGGGAHSDPGIRGGGLPKEFFSVLRASFWSKIRGGGPPGPSPGFDTEQYLFFFY